MTQITYDAARDTSGVGSGAHTVTVGTGALTLAGTAGISLDGTATKAELLEALKTLAHVISRQFSQVTRPGVIDFGDALLTEGGDFLADEDGNILSLSWFDELPALTGGLQAGDTLIFVEDGTLVQIDAAGFVTSAMISDNVVAAGCIEPGAVATAAITDGSVDTAFIADGAVTTANVDVAGMKADGTYTNVSSITIDQQGRVTALTES